LSNLKYPFLGVGHRLTEDDIDSLKPVAFNSYTYTQGYYLNEFEDSFGMYIGADKSSCVAVSNAACAMEMISDHVNLSKGDEVICTCHTYCASVYPFLRSGATIVWADIDKNTWLSEAEQIEKLITESTRVIVVVHLYGLPSDCTQSYTRWRNLGITIIEDCAQALGAYIGNTHVGLLSDFSIFSFQSHKNISTLGEGGMLVIRETVYEQNIKLNRHNGHCEYSRDSNMYWRPAMINVIAPYNDHRIPHNFCLNEFSCAIGVRLLGQYDIILGQRKTNYSIARKMTLDTPKLKMQHISPHKKSSYHLLPFRLEGYSTKEVDSVFSKMMYDYGVQCVKQYMPLYKYPLFQSGCPIRLIKNTEADVFYDQMISLPFHDGLHEADIEYIIGSLIKCIQ